jgi:hypothetical protein
MRRTRFVVMVVGLVLVGAASLSSIPPNRRDTAARHSPGTGEADRAERGNSEPGIANARRDATRLAAGAWTNPAGERAEQDQCRIDLRDETAALLAKLPAPTTVDEALGRALLGSMLEDHHATTNEFLSVARRWPDDVPAAWLAWEYCQKDRDCDRASILQHLLAVDADNALAWLASVDDAVQRRDEGAIAISLRRAGMATDYRSQGPLVFFLARPLLARLDAPVSCHGLDEDSLRAMLGRAPVPGDIGDAMAQGMAMATIGVGLRIDQACDIRLQRLSENRKRDCAKALEWMARSGTSIARAIATRLLIRIFGPHDSAPWREQYRQLCWLRQVGPPAIMPSGAIDHLWADGEIATQIAWARDAGLWPPPPNWLPSAPAQRRLIVEGR